MPRGRNNSNMPVIAADNSTAENTASATEATDNAEAADNADVSDSEIVEPDLVLVAVYPILYLSKQYKVGEQLPANDHDMTDAWISSGTAAWIVPDGGKTIARAAAALPGMTGTAVPVGENCLVGKVPEDGVKRGR